MRPRTSGIFITVFALMVAAGFLDKSDQASDLLPSPASEFVEPLILVACEPSQGSYVGPLVPNQVTPRPVADLRNVELKDAIPGQLWSSRVGFSISYATDPRYWAQQLGSGWYLDWSMHEEMTKPGPEHWQMVRVHEDCVSPAPEAIRSTAAHHPGQVWIIGNEPDVIWQDNVMPKRYAVVYYELYRLIKFADPSAQVAVGGISQATPLRFQYLDAVLQTYQDLYNASLPADWWTVHGYVLREEKNSWGVEIPPGIDAMQGELYEVSDHGRLDLFIKQITTFRQWMKENGYQSTPLALTEFGILMPTSYGFPHETIANYLEETFTWLNQAKEETIGYPDDDYHLVQKWAWFSISDPNYPASDLGDLATGDLTLVGERFRNVVSTKGR